MLLCDLHPLHLLLEPGVCTQFFLILLYDILARHPLWGSLLGKCIGTIPEAVETAASKTGRWATGAIVLISPLFLISISPPVVASNVAILGHTSLAPSFLTVLFLLLCIAVPSGAQGYKCSLGDTGLAIASFEVVPELVGHISKSHLAAKHSVLTCIFEPCGPLFVAVRNGLYEILEPRRGMGRLRNSLFPSFTESPLPY